METIIIKKETSSLKSQKRSEGTTQSINNTFRRTNTGGDTLQCDAEVDKYENSVTVENRPFLFEIPASNAALHESDEQKPQSLFCSVKLPELGMYFSRTDNLPTNNAAIDLLSVIVSFFTAHVFYLGHLNLTSQRTVVLCGALVSILLCLMLGGAYANKRENRLSSEMASLLMCWVAAFGAIGLFAFLTKTAGDVSRVWIGTSMIASLLLIAAFRVASRIRFFSTGENYSENIVICGIPSSIDSLRESLHSMNFSNISVANVFELRPNNGKGLKYSENLSLDAKPILNYIEKRRKRGSAIDQIWIAVPSYQSALIEELLDALSDSSVDVCVVPDTFNERLINGERTYVGSTSVINISEISCKPGSDTFKRLFDFGLALCGLMVLSIPMAIIASLIKLTSEGPAVFRQKRYGMDGQEIEVYKFRSMKLHSDNQVVQATKNDSRVTTIGRILRKTSLDELPQLINVLQGNMSLVGPRPHAVAHNELWRTQIKGYMLRHKVRPGITGLAQVNGWRGETDTEHKMAQRVKYDLKYIREWSPWLDVKILFLTVFKGFTGETAY